KEPAIAFNFGMTGAGPLVETIVLTRLLAQGVRPNFVLIEALPAMFDSELSGVEVTRISTNRTWFQDFPLLVSHGREANELALRWWQEALIPCYSGRFAMMNQLAIEFLPAERRLDWVFSLDETGWALVSRTSVPRELHERALEQEQNCYQPI